MQMLRERLALERHRNGATQAVSALQHDLARRSETDGNEPLLTVKTDDDDAATARDFAHLGKREHEQPATRRQGGDVRWSGRKLGGGFVGMI